MRVERDWLRRLIFNRDEFRRFTQDSAVLPDVWLAGGMFYCRDQRARVDLLLTPFKDRAPSVLAAMLRQRLEYLPDEGEPTHQMHDVHARRMRAVWSDMWSQRRVLLRPSWALAVNQTNVVAALTLEELITAVLPLSHWWRKQRDALDDDDGKKPTPVALQARAQFAWLQRIVGVMLLCSRESSEPEEDLERQDEAAAWLTLDETRRLRRASRGDAERFAQIVRDETGQRVEFERLLRKAERIDQKVQKGLSETENDLKEELRREPRFLWDVALNRASFVSMQKSVHTTKADAARRVFDINCSKLRWAVLDSGIDAIHPAFKDGDGRKRVTHAYDFTNLRALVSLDATPTTGPGAAFRSGNTEEHDRNAKRLRESLRAGRLLDWSRLLPLIKIPLDDATFVSPRNDHGTHVAGILAARETDEHPDMRGMCPDIQLCDLRVLNEAGRGDEFSIIAALQLIRYLNANSDRQVIHGVNISLSLLHDVENYACGRTPICDECERLVSSGVVVVVAAGNRGYETVLTSAGEIEGYRDISITDPGNAENVITVGSTHRNEPHTYGVSYFSSRGPTGDGRIKPDVLAPGEKIESTLLGGYYGPKDGTSMAAPHVSGVAALLMARYSEFVGQPMRIKKIICQSAMDLGREKYFQGNGLVDALRALQSV